MVMERKAGVARYSSLLLFIIRFGYLFRLAELDSIFKHGFFYQHSFPGSDITCLPAFACIGNNLKRHAGDHIFFTNHIVHDLACVIMQ